MADKCENKLIVRVILLTFEGWVGELARGLEITCTPESLYFEDGQVVKRVEGSATYRALLDKLLENSESKLYKLFSSLKEALPYE